MRVQDKRTGLIIEFPDGTDPATIAKAMQNLGQFAPAGGFDERFGSPDRTYPSGVAETGKPNMDLLRGMMQQPPPPRRPTIGEMAQSADDVVRSIARGVPILGALADRADPQPERDAAFAKAHPILAPALEIGGGVASMGAASALPGAAYAFGMKGPQLGNAALNLGARMVAGAGTGAALGAGDAAIRGGDAGEGAMWGAGFGAAGPAVGRAVGKQVAKYAARRAAKNVPTVDERRAAGAAAFRDATAAGVGISQQAASGVVNRLETAALGANYSRYLHRGIRGVLLDARSLSRQGSLSLDDLHTLRQRIQSAGKDMSNPDQQRISREMVDALDDYISSIPAGDLIAGDAARGAAALREGINQWRIMRKGETIARLWESAADKAGGNYTAAGMETALRQEFRALKRNPRQWSRFSAEEQEAITEVIRGGPTRNLMRLIGKLSPQNPLSSLLAIVAGQGSLGLGALALPVAGLGARAIASQGTKNAAQAVSDLVRAGGQLPVAATGRLVDQAATAITQGAGFPIARRMRTGQTF